jgi:hypothetical protein
VGSEISFRTHSGATALRYGQLSALDATGRRLPAHMQVHGRTIQLRIDDSHARYPLRIDPFIQQGEKVTGSGESGQAQFGFRVALSSDGKTALIGGPTDNSTLGAAWVFARSGSTWTQQGEKLTGSGESGPGNFGLSVALSSDGNTALIGASADNGYVGAAWVFTRSGSTWAQQGEKLTGGGEVLNGGRDAYFGGSVAVSSDGTTALIGGAVDSAGVGAAWAFVPAPAGSAAISGSSSQSVSAKGIFSTGVTVVCNAPVCAVYPNASAVVPKAFAAKKGKKKTIRVMLGATVLHLTNGQRELVKIKLSSRGQRILKRLGHLKVLVTVVVVANGRQPVVITRSITLKAPGKKH